MKQYLAYFGVGVGKCLDDPREPTVGIHVDLRNLPAQLPRSMGGLRARFLAMDRLHVTRSNSAPWQPKLDCKPRSAAKQASSLDSRALNDPRLKLN